MMKKLLTLLALGLSLSFGAAHAADATAAKSAQQTKMGTCNAEAKGLKGEEFKKKRNECLKAKPADGAAAPAPAENTVCEKSAADKKLHGAAKNAHVKKCMADNAAPAAATPATPAAPATAPAKK